MTRIEIPKKCERCGGSKLFVEQIGIKGGTAVNGRFVKKNSGFTLTENIFICGKCGNDYSQII